MPYGRASTGDVRNGIWEPLWGGSRALVHASAGEIVIRNDDGAPLAGYDLLRDALHEAVQADEAVVDGYLLPAPLRDTRRVESMGGLGSVMSAGEMRRQLILGSGRLGGKRREEAEAAQARRFEVPATSPTAFIAIDLLWLDGESLLDVPLAERKRLLDGVVIDGEVVRRTVSVRAPVEGWFAQWRALGFREVAVKGANSRYTPGIAGKDWATALIPKR